MKAKTALFGGALIAAGITSGASAQLVMDFQSLESNGTGFIDHGFSYSANGFTVSHPNSEPFEFTTAETGNTSFYQGSTMLFNNTVNGVITLAQDNGNPFDMDSIDIAALFVGGTNTTVNFTGNLNGGGQVFASFTTSSGTGIETFSFAGLGFDNLDNMTWIQESSGGTFHQFDNVTVGVIPAPASLALLGLGGLVATRRRR